MSNVLSLTNTNGILYVNHHYVNPTGTIICFAGQSAPPGWILCDGTEVSKSEYPNLFSIIGNIYGTPQHSGNFMLPNLQQRMPLGKSIGNNLGDNGGNSNITLSTNQLPSHNHTGTTNSSGVHSHTTTDSGHNHSYNDAFFAENTGGTTNIYGTSAPTDFDNEYIYRTPTPVTSTGFANITVANNGEHTHTFTTDTTGSSSSINIMNPYLVVNYLIKY